MEGQENKALKSLKSVLNANIYSWMILFLVLLSTISALFYGFGLKSLANVLIAVVAAALADLLLAYFISKKFAVPKSAIISGLFIGGILTQGLNWYIYALASIIAVASKHIIKIKERRIFNPANIGILLVSVIFGAAHTWWLASPIIFVTLFGIFVVWRMKRFELILSFLIAYFAYTSIYSSLLNSNTLIFFACFMLLEPKTTPLIKRHRVFYGIFVAIAFIMFEKMIPAHSLPLALAVGNVVGLVISSTKFS